MDIYEALDYGSLNLEHHGVLGMRWGHRKQRIEERRAIFNRAAIKSANEALTYSNRYRKAMADKNVNAARQARRNAINARAESANYMLNALGGRMYTKGDLKYAQKYINGKATMKDLHNRAKRRMALGFAALGATVAVPTVANAVYGRRLV